MIKYTLLGLLGLALVLDSITRLFLVGAVIATGGEGPLTFGVLLGAIVWGPLGGYLLIRAIKGVRRLRSTKRAF